MATALLAAEFTTGLAWSAGLFPFEQEKIDTSAIAAIAKSGLNPAPGLRAFEPFSGVKAFTEELFFSRRPAKHKNIKTPLKVTFDMLDNVDKTNGIPH